MPTKRKLDFGAYIDTITRNLGKNATPLVPHLEKRINQMRTNSQKKRAVQKVAKRTNVQRTLVRQEGSSTSRTTFNFGAKKLFQKDWKLTQPQFFVRNDAGFNIQSTAGLQAVFWTGHLGYSDLHAIRLQGPNTPTITGKSLVEYIEGETVFANSSSFTTVMTIYDIMVRRDTPVSAIASPQDAWSNGISDESAGGTYQTVGAEPWQSETFNQYYKIVGKAKLDLPSGGTHRHIIKWRPNTKVHSEVVENSMFTGGGLGSGGLKDLTVYTMVVFHGQPAHDSTTTASVTISAASLDVVHKTSIRYRYFQESSSDWTRSNNLAGSFAVGPQFVNDLVGQTQDGTGLHPTILIS